MSDQIKRRFKGVWIPKAIWEHPDLTWLQKCIVAEVDSLSDDMVPCTAGNDFFAARFGVTVGRAANMLSELRTKGIIENVGFDGRTRGMRVCPAFTDSVNPALTESVKADNGIREGRVHGIREGRTPPHISIEHPIENNKRRGAVLHPETGAVIGRILKSHREARGRPLLYSANGDRRQISNMLDQGFPAEQIAQTAAAAFTAPDDGKLWWCPKVASLKFFATHYGEISNELERLKNGKANNRNTPVNPRNASTCTPTTDFEAVLARRAARAAAAVAGQVDETADAPQQGAV